MHVFLTVPVKYFKIIQGPPKPKPANKQSNQNLNVESFTKRNTTSLIRSAIPAHEAHRWAVIRRSCISNEDCAYVNGFSFLTGANDFCYKWQYVTLEGNYFGWMGVCGLDAEWLVRVGRRREPRWLTGC